MLSIVLSDATALQFVGRIDIATAHFDTFISVALSMIYILWQMFNIINVTMRYCIEYSSKSNVHNIKIRRAIKYLILFVFSESCMHPRELCPITQSMPNTKRTGITL